MITLGTKKAKECFILTVGAKTTLAFLSVIPFFGVGGGELHLEPPGASKCGGLSSLSSGFASINELTSLCLMGWICMYS